jgi:neurofibromin 1
MQSGFARALEKTMRSNCDTFVQILQSLFTSIDRVPPPVRRLVSVFQRSVQDFFPKSNYIVSTGYLFLRVIVPYITSPDGFGCYHRPIDQSGRRNLILVAKVLQNLANDALFGAKEAYMVGMNAFMGLALPQCQKYINDLGRSPSVPVEVPAADDRSTIEDQMRLHRMLLKVFNATRALCLL